MSCGIDGSTGKCDYGGAASPTNLYYLADVPHNDECETTSFLHLENGIKTWDFECKGFCLFASASAASEDFSLAASGTVLCLVVKEQGVW